MDNVMMSGELHQSAIQVGQSPGKTQKVDLNHERSMSMILQTTACTQTRLNETNSSGCPDNPYSNANDTSHFGNLS